jgi:hypothetical protein
VIAMPFLTLGLEQFVQWKYGLMGTVGFCLLTFGIRTGSPNCAGAGAIVLALLLIPTDH